MKILNILTVDHYYIVPYSYIDLGILIYRSALIDTNTDKVMHLGSRLSEEDAITVALNTVRNTKLNQTEAANLAMAV